MQEAELKECRAYVEDGRIYLWLKYTYENDKGIYEMTIPKVKIDIPTTYMPGVIEEKTNYTMPLLSDFLLHGFEGNCYKMQYVTKIDGNELSSPATNFSKLVKEKVCEMTVSEIETRLGYKVKIISD